MWFRTVRRSCLAVALLLSAMAIQGQTNPAAIKADDVRAAEKLFGLDFSDEKLQMLLPGLRAQLEDYLEIRNFPLSNSVFPAVQFNPIPMSFRFPDQRPAFKVDLPRKVKL